MKLIKPSFSILPQSDGLEGIYRQIEMAGRTCYKSEDKITETSAKEFVDRMIKSGHGAMLEHGTVYLKAGYEVEIFAGQEEMTNPLLNYIDNKYSKTVEYDGVLYVTTNLRVLVENGWLHNLEYICKPTEHHERRYTVKFICDRGVSHEFVRHRVFSFAQESTRYCNYSKDKFGNELTFIIPLWCNIPDNPSNEEEKKIWLGEKGSFEEKFMMHCLIAENHYNELIELQYKPQQARAVLPNSLKTELVMTGFVSDWKHFFELRDAKSAHPQALELASPLHQEFINKGYI